MKTTKNLFLTVSLLSIFSAALCSCSAPIGTTKSAFRNRDNDYIAQPISESPAPVTPQGLTPIQTQPVYTIPNGPSSYPGKSKPVNLQPPTLNN